jgi:lysyl-tRNA synthetase class 2
MTQWRPVSGPETAMCRAKILRSLRKYFDSEAVIEVDTPALSFAAVSDVQVESLSVSSTLSDAPLYLHTSPEYCMKRLLAAGYPDIYSICRVFRDGESGRRHQPEFKYQAIFVDVLGVDPITATIETLAKAADADADLRRALGDERDDWLDLLLATQVAPTFATDKLTVVKHYPASQAALARLCPDNPQFADRFEVFMGAVELANGYVELTDANEQADRIADDQAQRKRRGLAERPHDQSLLEALESGLPSCAGVAMGLERLHMMHDKTEDIRDVIPFVFENKNG